MKATCLFLLVFLCLCIFGCGSDEDDVEVEESVPVSFASASPPGGYLASNGTITVTFDGVPRDVRVSQGTVKVVGKTAMISGPFNPAPITLTLTWADGILKLNYYVNFHGGFHSDPHLIPTGGTVKDGDKDVDPETINTAGIIVIEFSEDVSGHIAMQTEDGEDVGWIGKVEGNKATLELVKGKEIRNETTYIIAGKVADALGNSTDVSVTFVTQAKA